MLGIKGIAVQIYTKTKTGEDDFGADIFSETVETVQNVIVSPTSDTEIVNDMQMYGKHSIYTLCIPKGDTHNWEDVKIVFFGKSWKSFGPVTEYIEENVPLSWNKKVKVELYG